MNAWSAFLTRSADLAREAVERLEQRRKTSASGSGGTNFGSFAALDADHLPVLYVTPRTCCHCFAHAHGTVGGRGRHVDGCSSDAAVVGATAAVEDGGYNLLYVERPRKDEPLCVGTIRAAFLKQVPLYAESPFHVQIRFKLPTPQNAKGLFGEYVWADLPDAAVPPTVDAAPPATDASSTSVSSTASAVIIAKVTITTAPRRTPSNSYPSPHPQPSPQLPSQHGAPPAAAAAAGAAGDARWSPYPPAPQQPPQQQPKFSPPVSGQGKDPPAPSSGGATIQQRPHQQRQQHHRSSSTPNVPSAAAADMAAAAKRTAIELQRERKEKEQREIAQMSEVSEETKEALRAWSQTDTGAFKDLRTLLSTMDQVLWEGAAWQPVGLSQLVVMSPADLRRLYHSALLVTHPDKQMAGQSAENKVRAQHIFRALNEAFRVL